MNRTAIITIGIVLGAAIIVVVAWLLMAGNQPSNSTSQQPSTNTSQSQNDSTADNSPNGSTDNVTTQTNSVTIQDMSFSPATITVKKGTTVTWTNKDSVGHNVVSDSDAPAGGPPKTASLLSKDQTFSFKFDTVGTFSYHCAPHPFMQGTVEVTE